jgi:TRAP-type uncharacterized transport system substrate-binding protein
MLTEHPRMRLLLLAIATGLLALAATAFALRPLPPRVVVMSTGPPGSDFESLGMRYRDLLRRSGIELKLLPSEGGLENVRRLNDPRSGVSVAFAEGGLTSEAQSPTVVSLGTMFFEPLWVFSRVPIGYKLEGLRGKAVSIGPVGSGTHALALEFLRANGLDQNMADFQALAPEQASERLLRGTIAAAAMVASWNSKPVRKLLASPDITILNIQRANAYVALYPYLTKVILPAGVGSLALNLPPVDITLVAPKASLLVRSDLHPAIQYLLLDAGTEIHSAPGTFRDSGQFPAAERGDLPLSDEALQFYKTGPPSLQRYLPFWLAVMLTKLLVLLVPIFGIVYPALTFGPRLYEAWMHEKIDNLYSELKVIETQIEGGASAADVRAKLQLLRARAYSIRIPRMYARRAYQLRSHIELVNQRIESTRAHAD